MKINFNTINFQGIPIKPTANKIIHSRLNSVTGEQKGALDEFTLKLLSDIKDLFELAHSSIKSISKSGNTRNDIKNGYENLKKGIAGSRVLEFKNIGDNGEDIAVNLRIDHGKTQKTVIMINGEPLVINKRGEIEKNPTMRFYGQKTIREKGEKMEYYTQKEIDGLNTINHFFALKKELKKYISYISSRNNKINRMREIQKENIHGSVEKYNDLINELTNEFTFFKKHINKLSENSVDKSIFRIYNRIKTFPSQPSIMLKDATTDGRSIYLVHATMKNKKTMKLFVMDYNNKTVDKSFITYDNKLVKYFPKTVNDRLKHYGYDFHYYSQEEIDNSEYEYYLKLALNRLKEVNYNLKEGIKERHLQNNR